MASIFTKIIKREIPAEFVHEDEICVGIRDINPQAPIHVVIFPKKEIRSLADIQPGDDAILGHMVGTASRIAAKLGLEANGYRVVMNTGRDGGQTVFHIHLHLLAGRPLTWPPG